ncbi:MAG: LacI family DNA-binding transcriptional regulator, partial [Eubacteriales bacterium]|nr:LacI family DNA-binding transcriptional regulator [Eubacteriales bacterium]
MLTIRDVAKFCNVSTATVSKAFSQDSDISYEEHCMYRNFAGVGVICADFFSPQVRALLAREIPCVTVDYSSEKHPCVMTNNEDAYG